MDNNYSFKPRAMVVDDDAVSRYLLVHMLEDYNFQVSEASQCEAAIQEFLCFKPEIVFLDQNLGTERGLDIAFFIRHLTAGRQVKIYLHTSQLESELISNRNYQHIDEYVMKGDIKKLTTIIEQYGVLQAGVAVIEK